MLSSIIYLVVLSAFLGLASWLIFLWAVKKGQMDDIEGPKYRILDDDALSPPESPTRGKSTMLAPLDSLALHSQRSGDSVPFVSSNTFRLLTRQSRLVHHVGIAVRASFLSF